MAEVKWIKLAADMFDNRKIKQIRKMPDGDALIVIWLQILCLAGQVNNNGLVYFSQDIPYTEEMLAVEFDRPVNTIRLALQTFEGFGMIEIVNSILLVSNWERYQSADKMAALREYNREKKREQRTRQKQVASGVLDMSLTCPRSQDTDIYSLSISKEKDKEGCGEKKEKQDIFEGRSFSPRMQEQIERWLSYKKERRESYKHTGLQSFLTQIENRLKFHSEADIIALIDECMANNWKGIIWDRIKNHVPESGGWKEFD